MATAGMRMLTEAEQTAIWSVVEAAIRSSAFVYGSSLTIGGEYEGIFNWMSVKYILSSSSGEAAPYLGALDLGGASTQITFDPEGGVILGNAYRVTADGEPYRLYSHSYMLSGQNEAQARHVKATSYDPWMSDRRRLQEAPGELGGLLESACYNEGLVQTFDLACPSGEGTCQYTVHGAGDFDACKNATDAILNLHNECLLEPCAAHGVYQPTPSGVQFYAANAFFYTVNGIGLVGWSETKAISPHQIAEAGAEWCAKPWSEIAGEYTSVYCFMSAYVSSLLEAYSIPPDDTSVTFARKLNGYSTGWTLGAQLFLMEEQTYSVAEDLPLPGRTAPPTAPAPLSATTDRWGIILDCGSSGTRAKLFTWPSSSSSWSIAEYTPEAEADEELLSTNPGISSYAGGTDGLEGYIDELLTQAARPRLRRWRDLAHLPLALATRWLYARVRQPAGSRKPPTRQPRCTRWPRRGCGC